MARMVMALMTRHLRCASMMTSSRLPVAPSTFTANGMTIVAVVLYVPLATWTVEDGAALLMAATMSADAVSHVS